MIITLQTVIFFRQTVLNVLDRILRPYYNKLSVTFGKNSDISEEEEPEQQVFSEFDDEKGVVFYPPVYLQRYAAVSDCLLDERWSGKLHKVVELGYHDLSFMKYLKEVPGIQCILAVDLESAPLCCSTDLVGYEGYGPKRDSPLQITLFQGNAADPDYRLIGCDAVIAIEMIEHMLPHDLDRLIHTVFGFIKPWIVIFTTPNADFNVLFKALGKNGLRRWDHFFEWTREQFHDWCSNIVNRYPNYTVTCKGIGPGPPGTTHLGCCSQMALFISKDYNKQQDLSINSLALVSGNAINPEMSNLGTWGKSEVPSDSNMLIPPENIDSFAEFTHTLEQSPANRSCLALMYTSQKNSNTQYSVDTETLLRKTAISLAPFAQHDKTSQCNLDAEACKNYLMLDYEQMCYAIVVPRKRHDGRVYMIEDVNNRLNCTNIHVKSFSKTTQNLINKNKDLPLVHTREVVDEIRYLTKMLNFNKDSMALETPENGVQHWRNINWGVDAPYWNQYYKVVKEYNSPYEVKSDECRITELISDEINRLIDSQFDNVNVDLNRLEIPIEHLMMVVSHITNDVEKVKDLLEWDGYEIVDDLVIHSRIVVDTASTRITNDDDWPENETYSDWESTEVRSTTLSDGSTMVPEQHAAKCLRRALDQKVRKLRTMLTADEDISTELEKVVCRLMKLALRTSEGRKQPPPSKWLQCKLLDLLTLTEKAIQRRKRQSVEKTLCQSIKALDYTALEKIKEDDTASKIVDKYQYLVNSENPRAIKDSSITAGIYGLLNGEFDDDLSVHSADYRTNYKYADPETGFEFEPNLQEISLLDPTDKKTKLERTQAWLEEDVNPTEDRSFNIEMHFDNDVSSGGDTEHSTSHRYSKESYRRYKKKTKCIELKCVVCKRSHSKVSDNDLTKYRASKNQSSKTKIVKKLTKKKSTSNNIATDNNTKSVAVRHRRYRVKSRKKEKPLHPTASKPIPASLIELCHPELVTDNKEIYIDHANECIPNEHVTPSDQTHGISAPKHSNLSEIITAETRETIAMNRKYGIALEEAMSFENETVIRDNVFDKHDAETDEYQTIFLNDINEPSTSKGLRHISMDVQCGPDVSAPNNLLSATTSTRMNSIFTAGIKIGSSSTDTKVQNTLNGTDEQLKSTTNCCTSTYYEEINFGMITPRKLMTGIKIKDTPNAAEQQELTVTLEQDSMTDRQGSPIHINQPTEKTKSAECYSKVQNTFNCTEAQLKFTTNCSTSIDFEEGDFGVLNLGSLESRKPIKGTTVKDEPNGAEQVDCQVTLKQVSMADTQGSPIPVKQLTVRAKSADCAGSSAIKDLRATAIPISNLLRLGYTSKLQQNSMHKRERGLMPMKQESQSPRSDESPDMKPKLDSTKLKNRSFIPQKQNSPTRKPGSNGTPKSISLIRRQICIAPENEIVTPRSASPSVKQKQPTKRKVISPKPGYQCSNTQRLESRREQGSHTATRPESPIQTCTKSKIPRLDSPIEKNLTVKRQQKWSNKNSRNSVILRTESPNRLYGPNKENLPNKVDSPKIQNAPNRLYSPNRPKSPKDHNSTSELNSPSILDSLDRHNTHDKLNSHNQYLYRKSESPTTGKALLQRSKSPIHTITAMHDEKLTTQNHNSPDIHYKPDMARKRDLSFGKDRKVEWINSILSASPMRDQNLSVLQKKHPMAIQELDLNSAENQEIGMKTSKFLVNTKFSGSTKCLESEPSSIKMDSGSEFYGSFASMPKTTLSLGTCDLNTTLFIKKDGVDSKKLTRYIRPKLCYGGVQVHSYRDKESSEDVMFQGGWQNYRPKVFTKRKICNPIKRTTESVSKRRVCPKEKISVTSYLRNNTPTPQKHPPTQKKEQTKMNQSVVKNEYIANISGNIKKPFRNVVKAPSKLTMSSASPKYNNKSVFLVINPSKAVLAHQDDKPTNKALTKTKYLPSYLGQKTSEKKLKPKAREKCALNLSQHSSKTYVTTKINSSKPIERSHAEKIKRDLLKLQNRMAQPNYIVLRNEIEQNSSNNQTSKKTDSGKRRCGPNFTRNLSPLSQHSSTCSSNSVATVRAVASLSKNVPSHRLSNSSYRSSTANSSSESSTPSRNKKFIKRCKNQKIPDEKKFDNKENIPQTSRQPNSCGSKGGDKKTKGAYLTQHKVFVAHLKESPPLHATYKKPKSNVNLTKTDSLIEKSSKSPTISRVSSLKSEDFIPTHDNNTLSASTGTSNMVLVLEPQRTQHAPSTSTPMKDGSHLTADWKNNTLCSEGKMLHVENVETVMKNLIVKALDFINEPLESCSSVSSSTVILKREDNNTGLLDLTSSPISFKTVITNDDDTSFHNNLEEALYRSFDNESSSSVVSLTANSRMADTDLDLASFKSSTSFMKQSGRGSARNSSLKLASNSVSVNNIYERKDQPFAPVPQNIASAVANQAFSGFSLDVDLIGGDKPDPINRIDSETGSLAADATRQAISEELFVSGRSSDSFQSCVVEEDVVPSWLFQIIQQQAAEEDEDDETDPPMQDNAMYDVNGNDSIGIGAGAGDGRGMHSDPSQDSSGRGTSLSSSTSSDQSGTILMDPSAFVAQFEGGAALLQDSEDSSTVIVGVTEDGFEIVASDTVQIQSVPRATSSFARESRRARVEVTSDADADVSSLETDVPDSS